MDYIKEKKHKWANLQPTQINYLKISTDYMLMHVTSYGIKTIDVLCVLL